ncbi:MAG TPA: NHL repeat-containing protein [Nitrosopumilaceae archaeon]|nr:NHL repeat-containing protein [Nitrosopumilaceae archaeon]
MKTLHLAILIITGIFLPMLGLMPMLPAQATTQYAPSSSFGMSGNASGQFPFLPTNIAINSTGFIFVTETENDRVQIFDSSGNWKQVIAGEHHKSNCSMEGCNVISYDSTNGHFYAPTSIAINSTGFIFVADTGNDRVQIFDSSGNWKKTIGKTGYISVQFSSPRGIAINSTGFIFVADTGNDRIQIFDSSGNWKKSFGMFGFNSGQFHEPYDIAINSTGFIFVADAANNRVQIFDSSGNWKKSFGEAGNASGQFYLPTGIAINNNGFIFVADQINHRIQILDSSGSWMKSFDEADNAPFKYYQSYGIAINSTGFIFVADTTNHHIQIFRPMQIVPEFPFAVPVFLVSIASLIAFYRIRKI